MNFVEKLAVRTSQKHISTWYPNEKVFDFDLGTSTIITDEGVSTFLETKMLVTEEAVYFHSKGWDATIRVPYERITRMKRENDKLFIETDGAGFKGILMHCVKARDAITIALNFYRIKREGIRWNG